MNEPNFSLSIPDNGRRQLAVGWLILGLASLLASGVFSVLLVLSRTPYVQNIFPWVDFFRTALVVHVDLSVLVWFLAFGGALWSLNSTPRFLAAGRLALLLAAAGALVMASSPFFGAGEALMSNYIPVLQHPLFFMGLLLFTGGFGVLTLRAMGAIPSVGPWMEGAAALRFGLNTAAVSAMLALIAFAWSYFTVPAFLHGKPYYELLFWGGGHVLQFTYTLLMLVAWLWLASASGIRLTLSPRVALIFFGFGLVAVFFIPIIYYSYPVTSVEHRKLFTWLMRYGGSLAALPLSLALLHGLWRAEKARGEAQPLRAVLITSMVLFGAGGVIGFLISGTNVTIPAHYHGSIVGVTLAFMGLTYYLLPQFGYRLPDVKLARVQPWLYGGGQFLHILGLVISGGYGVQRKVAGAEQGLDTMGRIVGMGLMGIGGLIAIAGGFLFLYVCYGAMCPPRLFLRKA